jgi:uncharacterized membrane protein
MTNLQAWLTLVALVSPFVVALINRPTWSRTTKRFVMLGVSVLIAFVTGWLQGSFDEFSLSSVFVYLLSFVGAVQAVYAALEALPPTNKILDKAEMAFTKKSLPQVVQAKADVNTAAVEEFKDNVA